MGKAFINGRKYEYVGELDKEGNACGYGYCQKSSVMKFEGTFLEGKAHGLSKNFCSFHKNMCIVKLDDKQNKITYEWEYRFGERHGKATVKYEE